MSKIVKTVVVYKKTIKNLTDFILDMKYNK